MNKSWERPLGGAKGSPAPALTETARAALEARKFSSDVRVTQLRGLAVGLREKAPDKSHVFWTLADLLGEVAGELETLAAELFTLKTGGRP